MPSVAHGLAIDGSDGSVHDGSLLGCAEILPCVAPSVAHGRALGLPSTLRAAPVPRRCSWRVREPGIRAQGEQSDDGGGGGYDVEEQVTAAGGQYRLCWCASGFTCSVAPDFRVDFGELTVLGVDFVVILTVDSHPWAWPCYAYGMLVSTLGVGLTVY